MFLSVRFNIIPGTINLTEMDGLSGIRLHKDQVRARTCCIYLQMDPVRTDVRMSIPSPQEGGVCVCVSVCVCVCVCLI